MSKETRQFREKKYKEVIASNPYRGDDFKIFIYNDKKEKDNYNIRREVSSIRVPLKHIVTHSDDFMKEEMEDLRVLIKSQVGKKNFKKLCKIFRLK